MTADSTTDSTDSTDTTTVWRVQAEVDRFDGIPDFILTGMESYAAYDTELAAERFANAFQHNAHHIIDNVNEADDIDVTVKQHHPVSGGHPLE